MHLPNLLVITEAIMDLHQRIDSIKTTASAVVVSDPAEVAYAFQQITKEIIISKFLISAIELGNTILSVRLFSLLSFVLAKWPSLLIITLSLIH